MSTQASAIDLRLGAGPHPVRARRFLDAFSAAVHDAELEQRGYEIFHFFDSDFLSRLIFGYRDSLNQALIRETKERRPESNAGPRLLMGALLGQGIGAPPHMRALLPHLYEVRRAVEGPRSHEPRYSVKQAIDDLGIVKSLDRLQRALDTDAEANDLFARFVEQAPEIFYGTELLSGRWESRLARILALGISDTGPFEDAPEVVDTAAFEVLAREVAQTHDGRGSGGLSGVRDAMALATLSVAVAHPSEKRIARFYTETPRIHHAWRGSAEMRALLTYDTATGTRPDADYGEHGVPRTVEYYLIRALIPELAYTGPRNADAQAGESDVYRIADDLTETTKALERGGVRGSQLSEVRIGNRSLGEFTEEVSDLSLYGSAWRSLMEGIPAGLPLNLFNQITEVIAGERRRSEDLDKQFSMHVKDLWERTREVGEFTETYAHLREVLTRWKGALRPRVGSYCAHVGLTRWGLMPADVDEQALGRLIGLYAEWSGDQTSQADPLPTSRTAFVVEVSQRLRDMGTAPTRGPDELADCVAVLGLLWLVEDHASIIQYGERFLTGIELALSGAIGGLPAEALKDGRWGSYGSVVEALRGAAELAAEVAALRGQPRGEEANELVAHARRVVVRLQQSERMRYADPEVKAIAQGYVMFQVWLAFNQTLMAEGWSSDVKVRQPALVRESLQVSSSALETCDPESPSYPLLLNHCVYVASMARMIDGSIAELATKLMLIRLSAQQALSYRVDDTLGYYYYVRAGMTLATYRERSNSAIEDLREARRWLEDVPSDVRDPEVLAHRGLLRDLERQLGL
jgi:hypothetical protein